MEKVLVAVEATRNSYKKLESQLFAEMGSIAGTRKNQGKRAIDIFGILTDGTDWYLYKLATDRKIYRTRRLAFHSEELIERIVYMLNYAADATPPGSVMASTESITDQLQEISLNK